MIDVDFQKLLQVTYKEDYIARLEELESLGTLVGD